jgi:hypothetical protein
MAPPETVVVRLLAFVALAGLAGCAPASERREGEPAAGTSATATTPAQATASPAPAGSLPPPQAEPRYVGRWAARPDLCEGGAWRFTVDGAGLEDGPTCHFDSVAEIAGGYRIAATCKQDGKTRQGTATLRFAESARAMLVENLATLPDTGLVYCGPA